MKALSWSRCLCILFVATASLEVEGAEPAQRIVSKVSRYVGLSTLRKATTQFPDDCAGLVRAGYSAVGVDLLPERGLRGENAVTAIHRRARQARALKRSGPQAGDLVFFRETYDRNRDGRRNDGLTHVGIVESVDRRGTVTFIHRLGAGIVRSKLNLRHRAKRGAESGEIWNDFIRAKSGSSRAYLSGELFAGYASAARLVSTPKTRQAVAQARRPTN
jgi:cell wall-associated NlpC family hydrolase